MDVKYTNDGKKVVVIGSLNKEETIVREIFIINKKEIPSGKNFVVTSLHDAPAVSWKEKRLKEMEEEYDKNKSHYEKQIREARIEYRKEISVINAITQNSKALSKDFPEEEFKTLINFLNGDITYIVIGGHADWEILEFKEGINQEDEYDRESLKLITLFGKTDGTLSWKLNRYSDGSGSNREIYPCTSYKEALEKVKESKLKKAEDYLCDSVIKSAKKYKVKLPKDKLKEYYNKKLESVKRNKINNTDTLNKTNESINAIQKELDKLKKK